jgi:nuclear GTP-binding protein
LLFIFLQSVQDAESSYSEEKDKDLRSDEPEEKKLQKENIFGAGQSKRIWNELYKVS